MNEQLVLQKKLSRFLADEVFCTITEEDVLKQIDGKWTHKGIALTEGQVKVLKKEAEQFSNSNLYRILADELKWHARSKLEAAQTEQDMIASKLLSYFVDLLKTKIKKIATL